MRDTPYSRDMKYEDLQRRWKEIGDMIVNDEFCDWEDIIDAVSEWGAMADHYRESKLS